MIITVWSSFIKQYRGKNYSIRIQKVFIGMHAVVDGLDGLDGWEIFFINGNLFFALNWRQPYIIEQKFKK